MNTRTLRASTARFGVPVAGVMARRTWAPQVVGPALGVLNVVSMGTSGHPLGITSAFEDAAALLARRLAPDAMRTNTYLQAREDVPKVGWEWALIAGVALGSWASARAAGLTPAAVPERWVERFGDRPARRYVASFVEARC